MKSSFSMMGVFETLYLHMFPGLAKSIVKGMKAGDEEFAEEIDW
jgi:hypothetical protein